MVKEIYPHNDLLNASFHILEKIEAAVKEGIEDGITLDCIGCIAVLAATSEALLNAVGQLKNRKAATNNHLQYCITLINSVTHDQTAVTWVSAKSQVDLILIPER